MSLPTSLPALSSSSLKYPAQAAQTSLSARELPSKLDVSSLSLSQATLEELLLPALRASVAQLHTDSANEEAGIAALRDKLQTDTGRLATLTSQVAQVEQRIAELRAELAQAQQQWKALTDEEGQAQQKMTAHREQVALCEKAYERAQQRLLQQQKELQSVEQYCHSSTDRTAL